MKEIYFVYAIKSKVDGRIYIGLSTNPTRRLLEHNKGGTRSTKPFRHWGLLYQKKIGTRVLARKEEKKLK